MARILALARRRFLASSWLGAFAAYVLYRCAHRTLAQRGMRLVLGIYLALMMIHIATGFPPWDGRLPRR